MKPLVIDQVVLNQACAFFEERGAEGCEGTAMIARNSASGATRLLVPEQRAGVAPNFWVEVTDRGKQELLLALGVHDQYVARIHSHPERAFHSHTDDENPAITFDGALSIVVPFFGLGLRRGLDACAVFLRRGDRWVELRPGDARAEVVVVR